jgi:hypothetical protein
MGRKREIGWEIIRGLEQAIAYAQGERVAVRVTELPSPLEGPLRNGGGT